MKQKLYFTWIFQKKLLLPSIIISLILGFAGKGLNGEPLLKNAGFAYLFVLPLFQYMVYEVRNPDEYYFYYNLGLNKIQLWASTVINALFVEIIILIL